MNVSQDFNCKKAQSQRAITLLLALVISPFSLKKSTSVHHTTLRLLVTETPPEA